MSQFFRGAAGGGAIGDVTGPGSSTDNAVVRFDGTTGKLIQNSSSTLSDANVLSTGELNLTTELAVVYGGTGQTTYTDGQLLIGNTTGNTLNKATLTAGTGISIANGSGSITITATGGAFSWTDVTGTSQAMAVESGYTANNAALVTLTLPVTASFGDVIQVVGKGAGLFRIGQNAGQSINFTASTTTVGAAGHLTAIEQFASLELICTVANTTWTVVDSTGNFTVV